MHFSILQMTKLKQRMVRKLVQGYKATVLVFYCCYNELPETWWLKTMKMYHLSSGHKKAAVNFHGLKSRRWHGWFLLETQPESLSPCLFQLWRLRQAFAPSLHHSSLLLLLSHLLLPLLCQISPFPSSNDHISGHLDNLE